MKHLPVLFSLLLFSASSALGYELQGYADKVFSDISNCKVTTIGNNTWKATFSVNWLEMPTIVPTGWGMRISRGFLIFQYASNGKAINTYLPSANITMNGSIPAGDQGRFTLGNSYLTYGGIGWSSFSTHSADVVVNVTRADVAIVAMYPTNFYTNGVIFEKAGAVYFTVSQTTSKCQLLTTPNTPPMIVNLTMNAPDWDLGEIATGQQQKVMTNNADRLCISYLSTESAGKDFIVNATNANGIVNNRFILKHSLNPTNTLPYTLTLDSMGKRILLPNTDNSSIRFEDSGNQTCFTPTFDLYGSDNQEIGDYTDVITYEIVTKS